MSIGSPLLPRLLAVGASMGVRPIAMKLIVTSVITELLPGMKDVNVADELVKCVSLPSRSFVANAG